MKNKLYTLPPSAIILVSNHMFTISNKIPQAGDIILDRRDNTAKIVFFRDMNDNTIAIDTDLPENREFGISIDDVYVLKDFDPSFN